MLLLVSTYWLLYMVSLFEAITLCIFLPTMASSILFFWFHYQLMLVGVVLFRSCGVSFLDSSTRGFIVACGFVILICVNMHGILSLLEGRTLEESVKEVICAYSFCSTTYCTGTDSSDAQKLIAKGKICLETVGNATAVSTIIGTGLAISRSPEAAMVAIVRASPHTKIVIGTGMIGVVLFRSCGVSFLDCSTRGFIMACGFIIFLCINMHFILGTGLAIDRSPEAAMVAIVRSSPHTKIVIGVGLVVEAAGIALNFFNFVDLLLQYLTTMVVLAKDAVCKSI